MSDPAPCTRHARTVWMAYCPACTAWHLAVQVARRDGLGSDPAPRPDPAAHIRDTARALVPIGGSGSVAA